MSSGTAPPILQPAGPPPLPSQDPHEAMIDQRLHQTQRQLKGVDIAAGMLSLAVGALVYLFAAALIDHWLMPGGLGFWGRFLLLTILLGGAGVYFARHILPPLVYRISPLFAAQTIEHSRPSLKNSLINLLFLRSERAAIERELLAKRIYQCLERTTAANLAQVSPEAAVDRTHVIRLGYGLAAVLAVCALYLALSPKNPLVSFGRVIWPWAALPAPTRVTIDDVQPGDRLAKGEQAVEQGDYVGVSAHVRGLKPGESVLLYYTTADGQSVDQAIPMTRPDGDYRHRCQLPPGPLGLQQETTYYLAAGDCRTRQFRIEVQPALAIQVEAVDYRYPQYTELPPRTVERQGDLRAIEGTQVTIRAKASHPIRRATIEMDCDPRLALSMSPDGLAAIGQFTLAVSRDNPARGQHESYQLRFSDAEGRVNRRPIRHRIEVIPDLAPEVRLVEPPPDQIQLPADSQLDLRVRAEDPDFALRYVALRMEREGKSLPIRPLLNRVRPDKPHQGPLEAAYKFQPAKLGLKPGDKVAYLAEAADNKEPVANRSETERRTILIAPPQDPNSQQQPRQEPGQGAARGAEGQQGQNDGQPQKPDQPPEGQGAEQPQEKQEQKDQKGKEGAQAQEKTDQPQPPEKDPSAKPDKTEGQGQAQQGGQPGSQPGDQRADSPAGKQPEGPRQPIDGDTQPGDAIEKVLEHRAEQQKKPEGQPQQQPADKPQGQPEQAKPEQQQPGQEQPGQQQRGQQQPGTPSPKDRPDQRGQPQPASEQASDKSEPGAQQPGSEQGAQKPGGPAKQEQTGVEGQPEQKGPTQQPGAQKPAAKQPGQEQAAGEQQPGERQPDEGQPGAKAGPQQPKPDASTPAQQAQPEGAGTPPGQQQVPDSQQAGAKPVGPKEKPDGAPGMQAQPPDQADQPQEKSPSPGTSPKPDQPGGDPDAKQGTAGAGQQPEENKATPSPQEAGRERPKKPGAGQQPKPSDQGESATSPGISPKDSDSQGDTAGDRAGGGEQGGGQRAQKPGTGTAGTQTGSEQGDAQADQKGQGETGPKGGDQVKADRPTGSPAAKGEGPGNTAKQAPGAKPSPQPQDQAKPGSPEGKPGESGQPGQGQAPPQDPTKPGPHGPGIPGGGGIPGSQQPDPPTPPPPVQTPADPYNRDFAERQTTLALEHLKEQLAKEKPDQGLLDRLGWTRQDMEKFVQRWESMRRAAAEKGPEGETAKRKLDEALKSLGLQPRGTELRGGQVRQDQMRSLKDAGRFEPPPEWSELLRAYHRGVAESKE